jgi:hypothetical protein
MRQRLTDEERAEGLDMKDPSQLSLLVMNSLHQDLARIQWLLGAIPLQQSIDDIEKVKEKIVKIRSVSSRLIPD